LVALAIDSGGMVGVEEGMTGGDDVALPDADGALEAA
jgi:hypothetical protein